MQPLLIVSTELNTESRVLVFQNILSCLLDSFLEYLMINSFQINRFGARSLRRDIDFLRDWLERALKWFDPDLCDALCGLPVFERIELIADVMTFPELYQRHSKQKDPVALAEKRQLLPDLDDWLKLSSDKFWKQFRQRRIRQQPSAYQTHV